MAERPGRCRRSRRSTPSPQAIAARPSSARPGGPLPASTAAASTLMLSPRKRKRAPGRGANARTRRSSSCAGRVQSRRLSSRVSFGARGNAGLRLRDRLQAALVQPVQRGCHRFAAEFRQAVVQRAARGLRADGCALHQKHGAGVQAFVHRHDGDAGLAVAGQDRVLDRGRSPPAGQQRGVDIQAAESRRGQNRRRQQQPVGQR